MGKYEKKRSQQASKAWNAESDYDGYSLDGLRDVHNGRASYGEAAGPTVVSSSARGGRSDAWQSDNRQANDWQSNNWQADDWQTNDWQADACAQPEPYSAAGDPRTRRASRRSAAPRRDAQEPPAWTQLPDYDQPVREKPEKPRRRKKKHRLLRFILHVPITLFGLLLLAVLASILLAKMPESDQPIGPRKDGCCTILLCGTDVEGARTDAMLLLYLDRGNQTTRLLSLPRDTMVNRDNPVPKLNGAYWANGGDKGDVEKGMNMLMDYVKDLVGYRPDAYILLDLRCFSEFVDAMGGVSFDVPMDMYYDDPTQDLHIDLKAGLQKLDGEAAMELIRFRSGYSMADLQRVQVQRDFLKAAFEQWKSVLRLPRVSFSVRLLMKNAETDLGYRNFCWIALSLFKGTASTFESDTLPGEPAWVNGGAYYVENREKAAALINEKYNPYNTEIKAADLHPYGK